jgi:hypothetical protein
MRTANWIEKAFFSKYRYYKQDGTQEWMLRIFGITIGFHTDKPENYIAGFMLSLYNIAGMRDVQPNDLEQDMARYWSIPLLQALIGRRKSQEAVYDEVPHGVRIEGKWYLITRSWRWETYANIPWLAIRGSKFFVYHIKSEDEPNLPYFTFSHKEWKDRTPSPEEILIQARTLQQLHDDLGRDLAATFADPQPTESKKEE